RACLAFLIPAQADGPPACCTFDSVSETKRILIVEDDHELRRMFTTALTMEGFDVVEAANGMEALRIVSEAPPDLIVLDLVLPHVNGLVVQRELAAERSTRNIPIVVV